MKKANAATISFLPGILPNGIAKFKNGKSLDFLLNNGKCYLSGAIEESERKAMEIELKLQGYPFRVMP